MSPEPGNGLRVSPARMLPFLLLGAVSLSLPVARALQQPPDKSASRAARNCAEKARRLEEFGKKDNPRSRQTTRFTESEINSYLALDLSSKYHPSLKSLEVKFEDPGLKASAVVDFDLLGMSSTKFVARMLARLFSGVHTLTVHGKLVAAEGKGSFQLDEARFDGTALPNLLVEEIITAVGKKQKPPFDPMTPSEMPYRIRRVVVRKGTIDVYQ